MRNRPGYSTMWYRQNVEKGREYVRNWKRRNPERYLVKKARQRADRRGIPFSLTEDDVVLPAVCPALGIPLTVGEPGYRDDAASLDRVIADRGYTRGNVRVISVRANRLKGDDTLDDLETDLVARQPRRGASLEELAGIVSYMKGHQP